MCVNGFRISTSRATYLSELILPVTLKMTTENFAGEASRSLAIHICPAEAVESYRGWTSV